ncbi:MAG: acylphosphatase [Peptoniphilaceae bacterium]|nr:acylphosphatase [Peptoniphilaceae bacterium]MDY6018315.1 acylphosphatase [Anaerococcus sp.]
MVRYNIIFKGRVQGVGFRYRATMIADKLGLTGNITNLYNGDVECNIQGDKEKINTFIEKLGNSRFIYIDEIIKKEIRPIEESGFYVK